MWSSHHRRDKNLKSLNCLPLDFFSSNWVWRYHCTIFNSSSLYEKIWTNSLLLTGVIASFMKIFAHRRAKLAFCCSSKILYLPRSKEQWACMFQFPTAFPLYGFIVNPPPPSHHLYFAIPPLSCVCPRVSQYHLFIFPLLFYFFLQFSLDPLCFIDDLFFACYFLFSDVLLLVLDYFPKVVFLSLLSLLNFILTIWIICKMPLYSS